VLESRFNARQEKKYSNLECKTFEEKLWDMRLAEYAVGKLAA